MVLYLGRFKAFFAAGILVLAILYAHLFGGERVVLEAGFLFDIYILGYLSFSVFVAVKFGVEKYLFRLLVFWVSLFLFFAIYSLFSNGEFYLYEFLRSMRLFLYIIAFILSVNSLYFFEFDISYRDFDVFYIGISAVFLSVYALKFFLLGSSRPWLFSENNFEVSMFLIISLIYIERRLKSLPRMKVVYYFSSFVVAFLSFSKSAILALAVALSRSVKLKSISALLFFVVLVVFGILASYFVIMSRIGGGGLEELDRLIFFDVFYEEFSRGGVVSALFGAGAAHNLSDSACLTLRFWAESMFRNADYCNAAIFHSLFMRLVYEFGLVFLIVFLVSWGALLKRVYGRGLGFTVFLVLCVSSMSISGFSSGVVLWSIFLMLPFSTKLVGCEMEKSSKF